MYRFNENFSFYDEEKQPYSFEGEPYSRYVHHFGYVTDDSKYYINCNGGKHFFKTPNLRDFSLKFNVYYKAPAYVHRYGEGTVSFAIYFGYDRERRCGERIFFRYNENEKSLTVIRQEDVSDTVTNISEVKYEGFEWSVNSEIPFELSVSDGKATYNFNDVADTITVAKASGIIGINKEGGVGGIVISSAEISSDEDVKPTTVLAKKFTVPTLDGGEYDYGVDLEIKKYENGLCEIVCRLMGGVGYKPMPEIANTNWTAEYDEINNPYIRFIGKCPKEKLFLNNGWISFVDRVGQNSPKQRLLLEAEYAPTEDDPYVRRYYTYDFKSFKYFVFGYDYFKNFNFAMEGDRSEFVFTPDGELVYYGRPLENDILITMESPYEKELVKLAKSGAFHNDEKVLTHLKRNHYFTTNDELRFVVTVDSKYERRFANTKYTLTDAFFNPIREISPENTSLSKNIVATDRESAELWLSEKLAQGVYHIAVEYYYGEELKKRGYFAFEVIDPDSEISPQASSGLPSIHVGEDELTGPSPWSAKPSLNTIHYIDTIMCGPIWAEKNDVFDTLKALKRKLCIWGDGRTIGKLNLFDFEKAIKNCDYIEMSGPVSGGASGTPYLTWAGVYEGGPVREAYNEFARLHPEYNISVPEGRLTLEDIHTIEPYFAEWIHFANERIYPLLLEQSAKIKSINPKAKRFLYGPFAIYGSNGLGGDAYSWYKYVERGKLSTVFDGFMEFEDYPYNVGYRTSYSSWAMMTIKLVDPSVKVCPQLYDRFGKGCPDGYVNFPFPPLAESPVTPYQTVTQINEYLFNAVYYKDKHFKYWNDNYLMSLPIYAYEPNEKFDEIVYNWGVYTNNKPKCPVKSAVYLFKPSDRDIKCRFMPRRDFFVAKMLYNVSTAAMYYIHDLCATNGIPNGFVTDTALDLSTEMIDVLVLPSCIDLGEEELTKIRKLHKNGVALIATSDVTGLEDLFGVKKLDKTATVSKLYSDGDSEIITTVETHFNYASNGADVLIKTDVPGCDVMFTNGKCALINVSLSDVGSENFTRLPSSGARANISTIIKEACTRVIKELSSPVATATDGCGINILVSENGDTIIHLVDYTPYKPAPEKHSASVLFGEELECTGVEYLGNYPAKINLLYENGRIRGFETEIRQRESMLFKLIK